MKKVIVIHDKSSVGEWTFKERESTTRRSTFNIDEESLVLLEVDEDDAWAQKRREHQSQREELTVIDKRGFDRRRRGGLWALQEEEEVLPATLEERRRRAHHVWIWIKFRVGSGFRLDTAWRNVTRWWNVNGGDLDPLFRLEHGTPLQQIATKDQRR